MSSRVRSKRYMGPAIRWDSLMESSTRTAAARVIISQFSLQIISSRACGLFSSRMPFSR